MNVELGVEDVVKDRSMKVYRHYYYDVRVLVYTITLAARRYLMSAVGEHSNQQVHSNNLVIVIIEVISFSMYTNFGDDLNVIYKNFAP